MGWGDFFKAAVAVAAVVYTGGAAAALFEAGSVAAAAITFTTQALVTNIIVSTLVKQQQEDPQNASSPVQQLGTRVPAGASTTNKLSVVYGNAFMPHMVVDAKISTDQQTMWYVLAFSEVTDYGNITFDDPDRPNFPLVYWGDKKVQFDSSDKTKVTGLIDGVTGDVDTKVSGKINFYFYSDGSNNPLYNAAPATQIMGDSAIPAEQRWNWSYSMYKTAFCIVKIQYDQNAGVTGLPAISAYVRNSLTKPGSVLYDYMTNDRYGCGIDPSMIDSDSLVNGQYSLDSYSDGLVHFLDNGVQATQPRYRINGPITTGSTCLNNLQYIVNSCDTWLKWDETQGWWTIVINRSLSQAGDNVANLFTIYADLPSADNDTHQSGHFAYVVGGIDITPTDLNSMSNRVEVQFPSKWLRDQVDYAYIDLPESLMNPNEPTNTMTLTLPLVNNDVQAQYLGTRKLEAARDDINLSVTVDYAGIQVEAGDIVRIYHKMFGWDSEFSDGTYTGYGKLFRVIQVQEIPDNNGGLGAKMLLSEYNDTIYTDKSINAFQPARNTGITDPTLITAPGTPSVTSIVTTAAIPSFVITCTVPTSGAVYALEYWYANIPVGQTVQDSDFYLLQTQYNSSYPLYTNGATVTTTISGIPGNLTGYNYYFKVRASGAQSKSPFSTASSSFVWGPNPTATIIGQNFQTTFQPSPVTVGVFANGQPDYSNVKISLFGMVGPSVADFNNLTSNGAMPNSSWRVDSANITQSGISIGSVSESSDGTYAQWTTISNMTSNVATITVPIIYKDNTGVLHTSPAAVLNLNKTLPGQSGTRGVVTLAYVPVDYDPTTAGDTTLSGSFYSTTGFNPPIDKDGAVFYVQANGLSSTRRYNGTSNHWDTATIEIPGNVIVANTITGNQIKGNSIVSNNIQANAINTIHLNTDSVTSSKITANAINTNHITAGSITTSLVSANAITSSKITANAITSNLINSNAIETRHITTDSIVSNHITANAITAGKIGANAVTTDTLVAGAVTAEKIKAGAISTDKLAANFIYSGNIQSFNATMGSNTSPGFWFDSTTGTGHFGNSLSVGLLIESSQLRANVVTAENLVIGSVTQSRSTTSNPQTQLVSYYNFPDPNHSSWPNNTRGIIPPSGVTIVPTTDPTSSANVQYTQGSRIEVGISVKLYGNANTEYNIVEVWKSGATSYYDRGINTIRHSYDFTTGGVGPSTIHAYGYGGIDKISYDGGATWSDYTNASTTATITGAITSYTTMSGTKLNTKIVGPLQVSDTGSSGTPTANWGQRYRAGISTPPIPLTMYYTTYVSTGYLYQSYQALEVTPNTGLNGTPNESGVSDGHGAFAVGYQGTILYSPNTALDGPAGYSSWVSESISGMLYTINSVYAGVAQTSGAKNYTAVAVGDNGTIVVSNRTVSTNSYPWSARTLHKHDTTENLLTNLYGVASDNTTYGSTTKWVAVGQYGTIAYSSDNGDTWQHVPLTDISQNLFSVRYGNGKWVVVGQGGVILTSTDCINWTRLYAYNTVLADNTTKDLNSIDYSSVYNTFNIGGQDGIYHSDAGTLNFTEVVVISPAKSYSMTRLAFWGSNPNTFDSTIPLEQNRLVNGQIVSGTVVDTAYSAGQETTYYLVVGNMAGKYVWAGQAFINATEVKR